MANLGNQLGPAVAQGLTRTMRAVEQHELNAMEAQIDRPTPFTLNSLWLQEARPTHLDTTLGIKHIAAKYLTRPIQGGDVDNTLVPVLGNLKLNRYGNIIGKRGGVKLIKKKGPRRFYKEIGGTFGVWERQKDKQRSLKLLVFKDPDAPRAPRWKYFDTAQRVIEGRVLRDLSAAIQAALRG